MCHILKCSVYATHCNKHILAIITNNEFTAYITLLILPENNLPYRQCINGAVGITFVKITMILNFVTTIS